MSAKIRILHDPPLDGPTNMARDEALLTLAGTTGFMPTLRLYEWDPPTISLGYFQPFAAYEELDPPAGDLAVVRRLTGGGAILHDRELTYALTLPIDHPLLTRGPNDLYEMAHEAVQVCLARLAVSASAACFTDDSTPTRGPFFCFERRHKFDLLVGSDKVAGSAQRRTRQGVLQHGSIVLDNRFSQQPTATVPLPFDEAVRAVRMGIVEAFKEILSIELEPGEWQAEELEAAHALIAKYAGNDWTRRT